MLDTNMCVHLIRNDPPPVPARFEALKFRNVVMSAVTCAELRHGIERDPTTKWSAERALRGVQSLIPVIAFDTDAAVPCGALTAAAKMRRRDVLDRMIGAHALSMGLALVTNKLADYKDFAGLFSDKWVQG